jgi:hypothetical protein
MYQLLTSYFEFSYISGEMNLFSDNLRSERRNCGSSVVDFINRRIWGEGKLSLVDVLGFPRRGAMAMVVDATDKVGG